MKINLLDPGFGVASGHHYDWNTRIAKHLVASGHEVSVYAHVQAQPAALLGFDSKVRVDPLFEMMPYVGTFDFDPICGEIQRQLVGTRSIINDLEKVGPADHWLWPTAFAYQLRACALIDTRATMSFCLHTPPDNGSGIPRHAESGAWWRMAAKSLRSTPNRVLAIGSVEAECVPSFLSFMGELNPVHLPMPIDGTPTRRTELKAVGFLGGQRAAQGRHLIGDLITRCLSAGFKVLTQEDESVPAALRLHPNLTVLGFRGDFPSKVERCDLLVAPYVADVYRAGRGSGVVWQAIASGVPCVAPLHSCPGRSLEDVGSGSFFSELSANSVFEGILYAQKSYPVLADAAFRGAKEYCEHNGLSRFIDVMINGASVKF
jgi:hypothetical protein